MVYRKTDEMIQRSDTIINQTSQSTSRRRTHRKVLVGNTASKKTGKTSQPVPMTTWRGSNPLPRLTEVAPGDRLVTSRLGLNR